MTLRNLRRHWSTRFSFQKRLNRWTALHRSKSKLLLKGVKMSENPVNSEQARYELGSKIQCPACNTIGRNQCITCGGSGVIVKPWSRTYMWAVKKAMGIEGRLLYVSDVRKFVKNTPNFNSKSQKGDVTLLSEALDYIRNPRSSIKAQLVARLEGRIG